MRARARALRTQLAGVELAAFESRILALSQLAASRCVAGYVAFGGELPTDGVLSALRRRGARVALPRIEGDTLALHLSAEGAHLRPGSRGVLEPRADDPELDPADVDLFLVPGLLFDRSGRRLGRGGGHFDRLLARARPEARFVGLCHAARIVDALPEDPWDIRMHLIVTTLEVIANEPVSRR